MRHCKFFSLLFTLLVTISTAQVVTPSFRNYTAEDGLPSSELYVAIQDKNGNIWFGSDRGVSKFNGYEFESYTYKDGLTDNTVFRLFEDHNGRIWILTYSGRIYYHQEKRIIPYKYNDQLLKVNNGRLPTGLYVDSQENVFVSLRDHGVFQIDRNGKLRWDYYSENNSSINYLIDEISPGVILTSIIWPGPDNGKINIAHVHDGIMDTISFVAGSGDRFNAIRLSEDSLLMSVGNSLYLRTNNSTVLWKKFPGTVFFLSKDNQKNVLAGTEHGAFIISIRHGKLNVQYYLGSDNVTGLIRDHEGGYWFTTLDNGVLYMPGYGISGIKFEDDRIQKPISLITDHRKSIFAGCWTGALVRIEGGEITNIFSGDVFDQPLTNLTLFPFSDKIYISRSGPAYYSDGKINLFKTISPLGVKTKYLQRPDGSIVCGGSSFVMRIRQDSVVIIGHIPQRVNCLSETNDHRLLVGSNSGVFLFDEASKSYSLFMPEFKNVRVDDIKLSGDVIFFATKGQGLLVLNKNKLTRIDESNGLCSDLINKILVVEKKVWCTSNKGVSYIEFFDEDYNDFTISNVRSSEGLLGDEVNDVAILNDTVYIATNEGVSFFHIKTDFVNREYPPVYISSVSVNSVDTSMENGSEFAYDYNNFHISFNAISFKSREKIKYYYRLISGKDTLTSITTNREVDFLRLHPGNYTFSVIAMNNSGIWSKVPATFSFCIMPAWWQTWWFMVIISAIVLAIAFLLYRRRIKKLKFAFETERRQASLQLTAMRAQMNPHFIFNVMNSIRNYMQNHDMKSAEKYLTSFSRLVRYTLDNSQVQEVTLEEELRAIRNYADLEMQRFDNGFDFSIQCEDGIDLNDTTLLSMLLQPYVENAIKHGISRAKCRGKIVVDIRKHNDAIVIAVEDNGVGVEDALNWNREHSGNHVSHGTTINQERIQAYNKVYNRKITTRVINLKDNDGKSSGTRVEVEVN